jgi:hypothetical protein
MSARFGRGGPEPPAPNRKSLPAGGGGGTRSGVAGHSQNRDDAGDGSEAIFRQAFRRARSGGGATNIPIDARSRGWGRMP